MNLYLAEGGSIFEKCWKINEQQRREEQCLFTAQEVSQIERSGIEGDLFKGTNILQSFYYANAFTENVIIPQCENFMLDSGAFTFFTKGSVVDWDEYLKKYAKFIQRNNIQLYFELDIDCLVGYEKTIYLRKKLEDMTGVPSIPVWHVSRGKDKFVEMCEQYKYVAFGGLNTDGISRKKIVEYMPWFISTAHQHGTKIHGLGFTSLKDLPNLHFDSVDSTAWVSGNRFGSVYKFTGKTMIKYDKKQGQRLADYKAVAIHNFREWVKFAQYAKTHF